uniref:rhodanese-like domain-containing protein n=1 Tax=uncultured Variovorax sp. TaxID=114708 RepID=UPI0025CE0A11
RQMGHDASVLEGGLESGLALAPAEAPAAPALGTIDAKALAARIERNEVAVVDLRGSMQFRAGHIAQARWSIRPRLAADLKGETRQIVLVADEASLAAWAAASELAAISPAPLLLSGGMAAWSGAGLPVQATPALPADADCIDYLFFVHDRHDGNKEAALRYLAWETGLVAQLDAQERAAFRLPASAHHG